MDEVWRTLRRHEITWRHLWIPLNLLVLLLRIFHQQLHLNTDDIEIIELQNLFMMVITVRETWIVHRALLICMYTLEIISIYIQGQQNTRLRTSDIRAHATRFDQRNDICAVLILRVEDWNGAWTEFLRTIAQVSPTLELQLSSLLRWSAFQSFIRVKWIGAPWISRQETWWKCPNIPMDTRILLAASALIVYWSSIELNSIARHQLPCHTPRQLLYFHL